MNQSETKLIESAESVEQARTHLAEMLADGDVSSIAKARKAYETAKQAHDDAVLAQGALDRREVHAKAEHLAAVKAAQRAEVARLVAERGKAADQAATLIAELGEVVAKLNDLHKEILIQLPGGFDGDHACMTAFNDRLLGEFWRKHALTGSPWSDWEMARMADLRQQVNTGNKYLVSL
jgi:hypothetical protein